MHAAETGGQASITLLQAHLPADDSRGDRQAIRHDQGATGTAARPPGPTAPTGECGADMGVDLRG